MNNQHLIANHLAKWAKASPNSPAVLAPGKQTSSYGAIWRLCTDVRTQLASDGIGRGHHVGVFARDRDVMAVLILAVGSMATAVPLALEQGGQNDQQSNGPIELSALIVDETSRSRLNDGHYSQRIPRYVVVPDRILAGNFTLHAPSNLAGEAPVDPQPDDAFVLLETSGTTGDPKVAPVSQQSLIISALRICPGLDLGAADLGLNALRLDHSAGVNEIVRAVVTDASMMFVRFDPGSFIDTVIGSDISWFNLVPTMHEAVLPSAVKSQARLADCKLRITRTGGGVMAEQLKKRLESVYTVPVIDGYGATECGAIAMDPGPGLRRFGSVGRVHHVDNVAVRGNDGQLSASGQPGTIWVSGPTVFSGYIGDADKNASSLVDGWYNTGDTGYLDDDGFLYLLGRSKESINRGGETIAPGEIERVLSIIPGVAAAAAFSVPHPTLGEDIWAAVTLSYDGTATADQLRRIASRTLPFQKTPKRVFIIDKFPVNRFGKVSRTQLRKMFSSVNPQLPSC